MKLTGWPVVLLAIGLVLGLLPAAQAQNLADPRLAPEIPTRLAQTERVPVLIRFSGRISDAREIWRHIDLTLAGRHGELQRTPNSRREFFAELDRTGLAFLLSFDSVESIYLPFELTLPGEPAS